MKLGIGSYACMWSIGFPGAMPDKPMNAFGLLERARQVGVQVVQYGPNLSLGNLSSDHLERLVDQASDAQIDIEVGTRGLHRNHIAEQLTLSKAAKSSLLRTVPEFSQGVIPCSRELESSLRALTGLLEETNIRLALENSRIPASELALVLDVVASPWIGITLDTANSLAIAEGTRHVAETLARHVMCLHIKDFQVKRMWHMMGFLVEGQPAGRGQLDVPWLLETLKTANAQCNAILELWPPEQDAPARTIALEQAWLDESISYLRRYISD